MDAAKGPDAPETQAAADEKQQETSVGIALTFVSVDQVPNQYPPARTLRAANPI